MSVSAGLTQLVECQLPKHRGGTPKAAERGVKARRNGGSVTPCDASLRPVTDRAGPGAGTDRLVELPNGPIEGEAVVH